MKNSNEKPYIIPGLREWAGQAGKYTITSGTRLLVHQKYAPNLKASVEYIQQEAQDTTGFSLPVEMATESEPGSIFLSLDLEDEQIGDQGYLLEIADRVTIRAHAATGVFYGGQTILQLLRQAPDRCSLPQGQARDWPHYTYRSLMLDTGRKYWEMDYLHDLIKDMGRLKLNELHLHLTDANAFRLQSERHPQLSAEKSYSKADIAQLQAWADQYHITLTPEIDLPAHSVVINQYNPRLAFACPSMAFGRWAEAQNGNWTINFADPYARQWIKELLSEYIPLFTGPFFHIGTDEVPDGDAPARCPELVQYALSKGYPHAGDVFVEWINEMSQFVRSFGKQMQIWSWWERSPHSISPDRNILVNAWVAAGDSHFFLDAGYRVIHTAEDTLYLTPSLDLFLDEAYLYNEWVLSEHPNSLGYKICVWANDTEEEPDALFEKDFHRPRAILAERTWCGGAPSRSLGAFLDLLDTIDPTIEQGAGHRLGSQKT
ncbi:MAG: family 20 glycosylhydrolase [Ardenticatenales bacterium]|nr:family 20 glycosylhydrolase [Ardenticatenales bacterium]